MVRLSQKDLHKLLSLGRVKVNSAIPNNCKKAKKTKKVKSPKQKFENVYPILAKLFIKHDIPIPALEYKFCSTRQWKIDIVWIKEKLAVEIEGGIWTGGRHINPSGFLKDVEKYNQLDIEGYDLLRFTPDQIESLEAFESILEWFKKRKRK